MRSCAKIGRKIRLALSSHSGGVVDKVCDAASLMVDQPNVPTSEAWRAVETLKSRFSLLTAVLASLAALSEAMGGLLRPFGLAVHPWDAIVLTALAGLAALAFVHEVRQRRRAPPAPTTAFIGADSFTEHDSHRFFGRDEEVRHVLRHLRDSHIRFYILYGDSGCGKTSIVRAGLIPVLEGDSRYATVYVRLFDTPIASLRHALNSLGGHQPGTVLSTNETNDAPTTAGPLYTDLRAIGSRINRQIVMFIDQFEEFFALTPGGPERLELTNFLGDCLRSTEVAAPIMVFVVRRDCFDRMSTFEVFVDNIFRQSNRSRVDFLTRVRARQIIKQSLATAATTTVGTIAWDDALIERLLDDLEIQRRENSLDETASIILPPELQIVCQMVERRGWRHPSQYVGKARLIRAYINDAISSSPNPNIAKRLLTALLHENGVTRAQPRAAAAIGRAIGLAETETRRYLDYFDRECRLVNLIRNQIDVNATEQQTYELAHEYLVSVVNSLTGAVVDNSRRANLVLNGYRARETYVPTVRPTLREWWLIRRYATEPITPEDRAILNRTVRAVVRTGIIGTSICVSLILFGRYGTLHFGVDSSGGQNGVVVMRRGLSYFQPLLGSQDVVIDTGVGIDELSPIGKAQTRAQMWLFDLWPARDRWSRHLEAWHVEWLVTVTVRGQGASTSVRRLARVGAHGERVIAALESRVRESDASELLDIVDAWQIAGGREVKLRDLLWARLREGRHASEAAAIGLFALGVSESLILRALGSVQEVTYARADFDDGRYMLAPSRVGSPERRSGLVISAQFNGLGRVIARARKRPGDAGPLARVLLERLAKASSAPELVAAATGVRQLGGYDESVQGMLADRLRDSNVDVSVTAADLLLDADRVHAGAMDSLVHRLTGSNRNDPSGYDVFWMAADSLARHDIAAAAVVDTLIEVLHGDAVVPSSKAAARLAAMRCRDQRFVRWLVERVADRSLSIAAAAAHDLGWIGVADADVIARLRGALLSPSTAVASMAGSSLVKLGVRDESVRRPLFDVLSRADDAESVGRAAEALFAIDPTDREPERVLLERLSAGHAAETVLVGLVKSGSQRRELTEWVAELSVPGLWWDDTLSDALAELLAGSTGDSGDVVGRLLVEARSSTAERSAAYRRVIRDGLLLWAKRQLRTDVKGNASVMAMLARLTKSEPTQALHRRLFVRDVREGAQDLLEGGVEGR